MPLAALLRERHPEVVLVSERRLSKLLTHLIDRGARVPFNAERPLALSADQLPGLEGSFADSTLPEWVLLLTSPEDRRLAGTDDSVIHAVYSRLVFAGSVGEILTPEHCQTAWQTLTPSARREARFVLDAERLLPADATDDEVALVWAGHLVELLVYQPYAVEAYYPLLEISEELLAALPTSDAMSQLARACSLTDIGVSTTRRTDCITIPNETNPQIVEGWIAKGNFARAIVDARHTAAGDRVLREQFLGGLARILHWSDATIEEWHAALQPVIAAAAEATWPREKRALYDLQRLIADHSGPLDAVAPVEWLASFGRIPLRRSLEPVREVILARRLRSVEKQIERSTLPLEDRRPIESLLEAEIARAEERIRAEYGPLLQRIFDEVSYVPRNLPEQIGRDKTVAELLDRLSETGFLRLADVRDAIARNHLKLPDCSVQDFLRGDALLRADRLLHRSLYGVYHRGEVYLRAIQRFSSLAFGTPLGRWLTLYVALPYGGAFLTIEAVKHLAHAVGALVSLIQKLIQKPELGTAAAETHHAPAFDSTTLVAIALLGTVLLLIINVPAVRRTAFTIGSHIAWALRSLLIALPTLLLSSSITKWLIDNRVTRFFNAYILLPGLLTVAMMFALIVMGVGTRIVVPVGLVGFAAVALVGATRWGYELREELAETLHSMSRRVVGEVVPGIISGILWFFREILGLVERGLYAIDEWFRYREGQSKPSLAIKACVALLWFPFAYLLRFGFYLLLEPQVNPIKHFPVVTVSHKVLLPLIPSAAAALRVSVETAGLIISLIPGVFGFLVWEFKENWRLYAANRPKNLPAAPLGHHGETVRGLLRPGFHSGTIPKLFRKLRRWYADAARSDHPSRRDRLDHEHHHLHVAIKRLVERDLLAYWRAWPALAAQGEHHPEVHIGVQRIEISLGSLKLALENNSGTFRGTIDDPGWIVDLDEETRTLVKNTLRSFFAVAAAETVEWKNWLLITAVKD